jgi:hypothetical protein
MSEVLFEIDRQRPVEWLCVFAMLRGYIPSSAYQRSYASPASVYRSPRLSSHVTRLSSSDGFLIGEVGQHLLWRTCPDCEGRWPENGDYFHRDCNGRNGWQTICKYCRRRRERERYARDKALCN